MQPNYVVVFLADICIPLTTLLEADDAERVKQTRQAFRMAMRRHFSMAMEQILGRKVIAFMTQVHFDPNMAAEIFVLEPEEADEAPEEGLEQIAASEAGGHSTQAIRVSEAPQVSAAAQLVRAD
jgi:uncharacterized protein YbcI